MASNPGERVRDGDDSERLQRDLRYSAARHVLGLLHGSDVVVLARQSVEQGHLPDAVCVLATIREPRPVMSDVAPLFMEWLDEAGVAVPERGNAIWIVLGEWVAQIADGTIAPMEGVARIYDAFDQLDWDTFGVRPFMSDYWVRDDLLERKPWGIRTLVAEHDREIVQHAREWLTTYPTSR